MKRLEDVRRILFIRTDRIGDTLMNIPAIHLLRQTYPKAWIALLCSSQVVELFREHPDLDEVLTVDTDTLSGLRGRWGLFQKIKNASFDLAIISNPTKLFHLLTYFSRIPHRVGYRRKWGFLLNHTIADDKDKCLRHEIDSNMNLVKLVSDEIWDKMMPLRLSDKAGNKVDDFLSRQVANEMLIAIHVGTTNPKKRWPSERFAELADLIQSQEGVKVVLIGGQAEHQTGDQIFRKAILSVIDTIGLFDLRELTAFLGRKNVKALVSTDSGPAHIAWMQGTPVVVFFAKDVPGCNPVRWGPLDGRSEVIEKPVKDITVEEVFAALERVLSK